MSNAESNSFYPIGPTLRGDVVEGEPGYEELLFSEAVASAVGTTGVLIDLRTRADAQDHPEHMVGGVFVTLQPQGGNVWFLFRADDGGSSEVDSDSGCFVADGNELTRWVSANTPIVDVVCSADTKVLKNWFSQPPQR
jgi:hypothetical protein